MKKVAVWAVAAIAIIAFAAFAAFQVSPWPSALLIRSAFDKGGAAANAALATRLPKGIAAQYGIQYASNDDDALLDTFAPENAGAPLPAIVWVHGGAFVAGSRGDLTNYLQILAGKGYVTFALDYSLAPGARFPTPLRQVNAALAHIVENAEHYNIDPQRIFLAGDSAGAQIAAQTALTITDAAYAQRLGVTAGIARAPLRGLLLYCGPYDATQMDYEGAFAGFMRTVIWSYIGTRDPKDPRVAQMAVTPHLTPGYPPIFVSVGNADPLAPQSLAFADAAGAKGIAVDALFFSKDHQPPLEHEYQFILSDEAGQRALERSLAFLAAHGR